MYQVVVERSAEKDLKRLSTEVRPRAVAALMALAKNPRPTGSRKLAGTDNGLAHPRRLFPHHL